MSLTFRIDLLEFEAPLPLDRRVDILSVALKVGSEMAEGWASKTPCTLKRGISIAAAHSVVQKLLPHGAHLLMINERTGHRTRYPEGDIDVETEAAIDRSTAEVAKLRETEIFCPECGQPTREAAGICAHCDFQFAEPEEQAAAERDRAAAKLEAIRARKEAESERLKPKPLSSRERLRRKFARRARSLRENKPLMIAIGVIVAALVAFLAYYRNAADGEQIAPDEVDGPYEFGPPGYDFYEG